MITKDNLNAYDSLYLKANEVLAKLDSAKTRYQEIYNKPYAEGEEFVNNIDLYFAYLDILSAYEANEMKKEPENRDKDFQPIFTMLPFDEPRFKVNLNTRRIEIPSGFVGQQVQHDNFAETIWFEVDRYFDATDLSGTDITIQWENGREQGVTEAFNPIINLNIADVYGKIIFGWPLTTEITKQSGNVRFSIRFHKREGDNEIVYNLTTLPMNLKINDSLVVDLTDPDKILNTHDRFYKNLSYKSFYTITPAAMPELESLNAEGTLNRNGDLKENNELILLAKGGVPDKEDIVGGAGSLRYYWIRYNDKNDQIHPEYENLGEGNIVYEETKDTKVNKNEIYYEFNEEENKYIKKDMTNISNPAGYYQAYSQYTATQAGRYGVIVYNYYGGSEKAYVTPYLTNEGKINENQLFLINYAEEPSFSIIGGKNRYQLLPTEEISLKMDIDSKNGILSNYIWLVSDNENGDNATEIKTENNILNLKGDNFKEGYYRLSVTNERNTDIITKISDIWFRVTNHVQTPVLTAIKYNNITLTGEDIYNAVLNLKDSAASIEMVVDENIKSESLTYIWKDSEGKEVPAEMLDGNKLKISSDNQSGSYSCTIINTYNEEFTAENTFNIIVIY